MPTLLTETCPESSLQYCCFNCGTLEPVPISKWTVQEVCLSSLVADTNEYKVGVPSLLCEMMWTPRNRERSSLHRIPDDDDSVTATRRLSSKEAPWKEAKPGLWGHALADWPTKVAAATRIA
ncbi:Partitioning Defective 3 [Manis pentadactyla]|nr:Partitioning Defective 3 [Manis pentadactyla]